MQRMSEAHSSNLLQDLTLAHHEFSLTIINESGLIQRLLSEFQYVLEQAKTAWPSFKREPINFPRQLLADMIHHLKYSLARQHVFPAWLTALLLICFAVFSVVFLDRGPRAPSQTLSLEELSDVAILDLSREDSGIGKGRVGFSRGGGERLVPGPARSRGGGGSGNHNLGPPPVGKIPQPSEIQAPILSTLKINPVLPIAGVDLDPAFWTKLPERNFGDPRSKSNTPSNGPGDGGAIGSGKGLGIGEGVGPGVGPGSKGNIGGGEKRSGGGGPGCGLGYGPGTGCVGGDRVFSGSDVTERARVLSKPEPQYTEEARKKDITGTVVLRVVFSSSGEVTNIRAMQTLPAGLTEKAIAAARQIRFVPAKVYGRPVSMFMQLEYNFNLY